MPFEPLTPEEQKQFKPPCMSREHNPPAYMAVTRPMKWVCSACGASVILSPSVTYMAQVSMPALPERNIVGDEYGATAIAVSHRAHQRRLEQTRVRHAEWEKESASEAV